MPVLLPVQRWALTPPFHPYLCSHMLPTGSHRRSILCCTFRRVTPPRRYLAHCPMESGLSSGLHQRRPSPLLESTLDRDCLSHSISGRSSALTSQTGVWNHVPTI